MFKIKLYGKTLMFRRGTNLNINLTYRCNLSCYYCILNIVKGSRVECKEVDLETWKEEIDKFPVKIREVYITGGEPTLIPYMPELVKWLLYEKKYHVTLFTNLYDVDEILKIGKYYRLQVFATYHRGDDASFYEIAYHQLCDAGYRITSKEINLGARWKKTFSFSKEYPLVTDPKTQVAVQFVMTPDARSLFVGCYNSFLVLKHRFEKITR
jgi:hypothetical protein